MIAPEVIDAMIGAGATAEVIAAAWKADLAKQEEKVVEKRAKDAERQRRHRESRDVTVTACDETLQPSPQSPPLKSTPDPEKITPPLTPQPPVEARVLFAPPQGVEKGQWRAFRQQRKKALTDRSYLMICNKLKALEDAGYPPGEMIDLATERGWETVFEPRDQRNGSQSQSSLRGPRPDPTLELVRAARAAQSRDFGDHGETRLALPAGKFGRP